MLYKQYTELGFEALLKPAHNISDSIDSRIKLQV